MASRPSLCRWSCDQKRVLLLAALGRDRLALGPDGDRDLLGARQFPSLRDHHLEDAVLVGGPHILGLDALGQRDPGQQGAVGPLEAVEVVALGLLLEPALSLDRQGSVVEKTERDNFYRFERSY